VDYNNRGEIIVYQTEDGLTHVDVRFEGDTVWLSKSQMADLFQRDRTNIGRHISNIFKENELDEKSNVQKMHVPNSDRPVEYYSLAVIISVGYRVKSLRGTQFRQWATERLKEYMIKGFTLDDERLKGNGGGNYWKELLDRIRDIRSSEKMLYRQVLDLYATSLDYDPHSDESVRFFQIVQNKLHYAAHGHTAAEMIWERADAGNISHEQAMEKAEAEYRKYQKQTVTPVEEAYLETIQKAEKAAKAGNRKKQQR